MINLCFCIDENYATKLAAVLSSLKFSNRENKCCIYVITPGLSDKSQRIVKSSISDVDSFNLYFVESDDSDLNNMKAGGHISSATYIRFDIPRLLPEIDKVLYLDADLVIEDDLTKFWEVDIEGNYFAAIENPFFDRWESLSISREYGYFNAGVLLMNLTKLRHDDIKAQAIKYLSDNKELCKMFDQDALNVVCKGQWVKVDIRWNLQTSYLRKRKSLPECQQKEVLNALNAPGIIHYSSSSKPWDCLDAHPKSIRFLMHYRNFDNIKCKVGIISLVRLVVRYCYVKLVFVYQLKI